MAPAPETMTLRRHRDRVGRRRQPWLRRAGVGVLGLVVLLALLDAFGQRPSTSLVSGSAARLELYSPSSVRSGLVYTARFRIDAVKQLKDAVLVLAPGWADGYTFNGISPQPASESSDNGKLTFNVGHIEAGSHYTMFLSLQVNPTNVGHHAQTVWLYDGSTPLATIHHVVTIWP
jgi:hypothetical protein